MILNCHGVVGLNPTVFGSTPKQLSRLVPVLPRGGGVKFNTRPIYCMHQAEDLNDKERVQCSKNGQWFVVVWKYTQFFFVIRLGSGPWIFQPRQLFFWQFMQTLYDDEDDDDDDDDDDERLKLLTTNDGPDCQQ